jgi:hypothetical protein
VSTFSGFPSGEHSSRHPPVPAGDADETLPFSAVLAVVDHAGIRSLHPFSHPHMLIGRTPENDLMLNDPNVSTKHCELASEAGFLVVRDVGSANGTYVNERRISEARLKDADVVRVGKTTITVRLDEKRLRALVKGRRKWGVAVAVLLLGLLAAGVALRRQVLQREAEARGRYEGLVKASAQREVCSRAAAAFAALKHVDADIGARSIAIELQGNRVHMTKAGRDNNVALLALWRKRQQLYLDAATEVGTRQQAERDALEKVTRQGGRLANAKDRKIAFWIDGLLAERLGVTDALMTGLRDASKRTAQFVDLVERFTVRGDASAAQELASFQLGAGADDLLGKCEMDASRLASGVLGALNGLDDEG